jgi:radical SAM protein with 4Fe4S-binding SPASM domain
VRELFRDEAGRKAFDDRSGILDLNDPARWGEIGFPLEVAVELASVCNLRCVMCPVPRTTRPPALMDESVFGQVVEQVAGETGFLFLPQGFGETFLHPRWASFLGQARERGISPIVMLSNGMLLDSRNIERLLALQVDGLVVSIDGVTPETYESVRVGGKLEKVEANVLALLEARGNRTRPVLAVRIIRMTDTEKEVEAFLDRWRPRLGPSDLVLINEYNDWAGKVDDRRVATDTGPAPGHRSPCRMLWRNLSVQVDGRVSACCFDSEGELIVGDLREGRTLSQIWRGEELCRLRRAHLAGRLEDFPICQRCRNWG